MFVHIFVDRKKSQTHRQRNTPTCRAIPHCISSPPLPRNFSGRSPKEKHPFPFQKRNSPPAKSEMQGVFFFRDCRRTRRQAALQRDRSVLGGFKPPRAPRVAISRRDCFQNTFELCTIGTAKIRILFPKPQRSRREAAALLHSPHKILILQGFATLRVAPRLPMQIRK